MVVKKLMNNYIVYKHTTPSNKIYIGITSCGVERRWQKGKNYKHNKYFTNAINHDPYDTKEYTFLTFLLHPIP